MTTSTNPVPQKVK